MALRKENKVNDEIAHLRGYFLEDEPGCYFCHCLVHPVLVLHRVCILLSLELIGI